MFSIYFGKFRDGQRKQLVYLDLSSIVTSVNSIQEQKTRSSSKNTPLRVEFPTLFPLFGPNVCSNTVFSV